MSGTKKLWVAIVLLGVVLLSAWTGSRQFLQHRAIYPGGLTFVGRAEGILGSRFHRVFIWKSPDDSDPLPRVVLHFGGDVVPLDEFTPVFVSKHRGTLPEGGLYDSSGALLQYRFSDERLAWFSLQSGVGEFTGQTGGNVMPGVFGIGAPGHPAIRFPVSRGALVEAFGRPMRSPLVFAQ